jgi:hypothetical protein
MSIGTNGSEHSALSDPSVSEEGTKKADNEQGRPRIPEVAGEDKDKYPGNVAAGLKA